MSAGEFTGSVPGADEYEAAAAIAAIQRFIADHAPVASAPQVSVSAWTRAALLEGVRRQPPTTFPL